MPSKNVVKDDGKEENESPVGEDDDEYLGGASDVAPTAILVIGSDSAVTIVLDVRPCFSSSPSRRRPKPR